MSSGSDWIARLRLEPHPEGGYFRRVYTAATTVDCKQGLRPMATAIHYLLDREQPLGRLHRNRSDILHFLMDGGPIEYLLLTEAGSLQRCRLSADDRFLLVPGRCWKGSRLIDGATVGLVSEVVVPGFDYADHEFASEADMRNRYALQWPEIAPFLPCDRTPPHPAAINLP